MSLIVIKNGLLGFLNRSHTNQAVQPQKMARGLKFRIYVVEGLCYLYSGNKGADQLYSYCAADLHLVFAYAKILFSHNKAQIPTCAEDSTVQPRVAVDQRLCLPTVIMVNYQSAWSTATLGNWYYPCDYMSRIMRKPVFWVSDQVQHKPGCTVT